MQQRQLTIKYSRFSFKFNVQLKVYQSPYPFHIPSILRLKTTIFLYSHALISFYFKLGVRVYLILSFNLFFWFELFSSLFFVWKHITKYIKIFLYSPPFIHFESCPTSNTRLDCTERISKKQRWYKQGETV